jgi:hypothetical protein
MDVGKDKFSDEQVDEIQAKSINDSSQPRTAEAYVSLVSALRKSSALDLPVSKALNMVTNLPKMMSIIGRTTPAPIAATNAMMLSIQLILFV